MNLEQIGYNIKFLRDQNDWTQKGLAERLATSRSVIAKWENHVVTPDVASLVELSKVFDVTIDHIVGNHTLRDDLLKDFKRVYSSKTKSIDVEMMELVEYLMMHPLFKEQVYRLNKLPLRKQKSLHMLFANMIEEYERL